MKKIILILSMMIILVSSFGIAQYNSFWDGQNNYAKGNTELDSINSTNFNFDGVNNWVDGKLGIGVTSPSAPLQIGAEIGAEHLRFSFKTSPSFYNYIASSYDGGSDSINHIRFYVAKADKSHSEILRLRGDGSMLALTTYTQTVGATNRDLYIDNTGLIGYVSSSERYKKNIVDYNNNDWIYKLRPVKYDYIDEEKGINQVGLIAEEVAEINPNIVSYNIVYDEKTDEYIKQVETYTQSELIIPMLKEIQKLNKRVALLEKELSKTNPVITEKIITDQKIDYIEQPDFKKPIEEELGRSIEVKEVTKIEEISIKK